jgi:quercetin dioxygenase-like cupin family protein
MTKMPRRSTLKLGLVAAATPALGLARPAAAAMYGPEEGRELVEGVRQVDLGERDSMIPGYGRVSMRDIVYQPGAESSNPSMPNDMICHMAEGELEIDQGDGNTFLARQGDVWTCAEGTPETNTNASGAVAVMRVIDMHA